MCSSLSLQRVSSAIKHSTPSAAPCGGHRAAPVTSISENGMDAWHSVAGPVTGLGSRDTTGLQGPLFLVKSFVHSILQCLWNVCQCFTAFGSEQQNTYGSQTFKWKRAHLIKKMRIKASLKKMPPTSSTLNPTECC